MLAWLCDKLLQQKSGVMLNEQGHGSLAMMEGLSLCLIKHKSRKEV
jgi:hypothetical protein